MLPILIVGGIFVLGLSALLALSLGRAAALGDAELEDRRLRARAAGERPIRASRPSYAGLAPRSPGSAPMRSEAFSSMSSTRTRARVAR